MGTMVRLRATCVPIGTDPGSGLVALSRRPGFPTDTEQTLLRVAANQAAIAIQRWKSEAQVAEQARALRQVNETETALYNFTDALFRARTAQRHLRGRPGRRSPNTALRPRVDPSVRQVQCDALCGLARSLG